MKNFTRELKNIMTEDPGVPIMSPDELRARSQTIVILTNSAPDELLALAGPDRKATLLSVDPPMITLPYQKGVFKVRPEDIVFENHHTGRDVTEAGAEETPYEKFFASAMKKFGVSSPIELSPDDTKKFFNYVDKNWEAEEESDGSKNEILPAIGAVAGGLARGAMAVGRTASALGSLGGDENEGIIGSLVKGVFGGAAKKAVGGAAKKAAIGLKKVGVKDPASFAKGAGAGYVATKALSSKGKNKETEPHAHTTHAHEDVTTGKVGKKDKGSYQHAYKLALKKYQIHSADELDTPEERKGFTDYVDRLWKKGDIHRDKKEASIDTDITEAPKSRAQRDRERIKKQKQQQAKQKQKKQAATQKIATQAKQREERKREAEAARKTVAQKQEPEKSNTPIAKKPTPDTAEPQTQDREKEKDDKDKKNGIGSFIKQAAGAAKGAAVSQMGRYKEASATKAVTQQTKQYEDTTPKDVRANGKIVGTVEGSKKTPGKKKVRNEVSPPDRKHQVKGIKKHMKQKKGKDKIAKTYIDKKTGKRKETNPWALAWAQYDKYGVPSRIEKD